MSAVEDLTALSDPDFLDERRRVRERIEELQERYRLLDIEFVRRATAQWNTGSGLTRG
jgi:hypothetical protein